MEQIKIEGDLNYINGGQFEKIPAIKTFRAVWDLGLKEAKELIDSLQASGTICSDLPFPPPAGVHELKKIGFRVYSRAGALSLQRRLKQLVVAAIKQDEIGLAEDLLVAYKNLIRY